MRKLLCLTLFLLFPFLMNAQNEIDLWTENPPNSNDIRGREGSLEGERVFNVKDSKLYVYMPEKENANGTAIVICPGGAYRFLAMDHEGHTFAKWLAEQGIVSVVLKYRLPNQHSDVPLSDAEEAMRVVRKHQKDWNVERVGICGFSAGGHLASTLGTHFQFNKNAEDKKIIRPDFMILFYPVISMDEQITHAESRRYLIGNDPSREMIDRFSNEKQVTKDTPPTFLVLTSDDTAVVPENSIRFYQALLKNNIPVEMHIFEKGGHGFGINKTNLPVDEWRLLLNAWLKANNFSK